MVDGPVNLPQVAYACFAPASRLLRPPAADDHGFCPETALLGGYHRPPVRLVAYDRSGHRRLGALLNGGVVDLPELVGHPAFPVSMEGLVSRNGGTVLDAARHALELEGGQMRIEPSPGLLAPLLPASLRSAEAEDGDRRMYGPGEDIPWPDGAGWLDYRPKIAAVIGRPGRALDPDRAQEIIFGYTLVNDWVARDASGDPAPRAGAPIALGPSVVTADELDPSTVSVVATVDGEMWAATLLLSAREALATMIARASQDEEVCPGDAFAADPFSEPSGVNRGRALWPGARVELRADGIGSLRNRVGVAN
jgi:2-keto-4-pentenoate hydratase/2-oxohepta-3-ene-1,7-dioic acid hydratase in catechol pathway